MRLIEPIATPGFILRPAKDEEPGGFAADVVATDPSGAEVWGALGVSGDGGVAAVRFWVAPERRGRKLGAAMLRAAAGPLFDAGARRIETRPPVRDVAALRSAMRAGMRPEGTSRAAAWDGTDALVLAILPYDGHAPAPRGLPDLPGGELTDGTVSLRPLGPGDVEDHLRHRSTPDVYAGAALPLPPTPEEITESCQWRAAVDWLRGRAALMVIDDGSGYRGTIGLYHVSRVVGTAMIGYDLCQSARGKGYATRAVRLLCRWAFDAVGVDRLWAGTVAHNTASQAVLRRAGFRLEGVERGGLPGAGGRRRDTLVWALLAGN